MVQCPACGRENPEGFRFCGSCGAALPAEPAGEVRKTVTVLFADVVSSTALGERHDPESLRRVMARHFDEARAAIERHGGTVEKFIGDAVMAVFGIPTVHEDDALRAVRAADDIRSALAGLNEELERDWGVKLEVRIGLNTGEVVAGRGQTLVTGDPVNVAKRLEEAAGTGEILVGEATHRLVRDAVEAEAVEPLALKGKQETVGAFRVLTVHEGVPGRERRLDSPMVGRERERALLQQAYERAVGDRACHLFTVLGAAGVGKSRLIIEFLDGIGAEATVVRGSCLAYGEGITFWPLLEIVRRLYGEDLVSMIAARLTGDENAELIADRVAAAIGLTEHAGSSEETFWAVRKLFEAHASERPLVVVFDDVQWGEPTFLDLIEHVADLSRDAPILLVCLARPELLDARPGWAGGKFNATSVLLESLSDDESQQLMENLLGRAQLTEDVRARVAEAAEGNPLFVEEMLGMLIDDGLLERQNGSWVAAEDLSELAVPPSIQALLSARLDRLATHERAVIECASVEGKVFHRGAVAELSTLEVRAQVGGHLQTLVRKELVRPDRSAFAGEDAFRFRHLLIRDAAYESMPKELRAELHERFAGWLERTAEERVAEYEEILGYHLEQAYRYRTELAPEDEIARALGDRAAIQLATAGRRALLRGDGPAGANLLSRATELLPKIDGRRAALLLELGSRNGLIEIGELERADVVLLEAADTARACGERALELCATLERAQLRTMVDSSSFEAFKLATEQAIGELEELGDEAALARGWAMIAQVHLFELNGGAMAQALERSMEHARGAGDRRLEIESLVWLLRNCWFGPRPVDDGIRLCAEVLEEASGELFLESVAIQVLGALHAMRGEFDRGRELLDRAAAMQLDLGMKVAFAAGTAMMRSATELLAGDPIEAERRAREGCKILASIGERGYLSTLLGHLAVALYEQGRYDEAEETTREADRLSAPEDIESQRLWRSVQAKVLARRGELEQAEGLAREAVEFADRSDSYDRADTRLDLAQVLTIVGNVGEAAELLSEAISLYEEKGMTAGVSRASEIEARVRL